VKNRRKMFSMRSGKPRRRRGLAAISGAVILAATTVAVVTAGLATGTPGPYPADGPFLGWPARGEWASDAALEERAERTWDAASRGEAAGAHDDVRVLFASPNDLVGSVVVLEGRSHHGQPRLAILTGPRQLTQVSAGAELPLALRVDVPAPKPHTARQISFLTRAGPSPVKAIGDTDPEAGGDPQAEAATPLEVPDDGVLALGLAEPEGQVEGFTSWAWDSYSSGADGSSALAVSVLPPTATLANTKVIVTRNEATAYAGSPTYRGLGDRPLGGRIGEAYVEHLPSGFVAAGPLERTSGSVTRRYARGQQSIKVTELRRSPIAIQDLASIAGESLTSGPANSHGDRPMTELIGPGIRAFAWIQRPGLGYIVRATGGADAGIDAYHVAQARGAE